MTTPPIDLTRFLRRLACETPLMEEQAYVAMLSALPSRLGNMAAELPQLKALRERLKPQAVVQPNGVAIVPFEGVFMRKPDVFEMIFAGAEDTGALADLLNETAARSDVSAIVIAIDSPGGMTLGTPELADTVAAVNKTKPVVAYSSGLMASAAYWVGSQASAVVASRSARVGSIGVYAAVTDLSGLYAAMGVKVELFRNSEASLKAIGVPGTTLSDDQREHLRSDVQDTFEEFKAAITSKRPRISADAMRGQTLSGAAAVKAGLVDHIGSMADAVAIARRARG